MTDSRKASTYTVGLDRLSVSVPEPAELQPQRKTTDVRQTAADNRGTTLDGQFLGVLEDAFAAADSKNTGALDHGTAFVFWQYVFPGMPDKEVRKLADDIFQDIDPNGDMHISWTEIENYFNGNPGEWTEVDRMLRQNVLARSPTLKEAAWFVVEVDTPQYALVPPALSHLKTIVTILSNSTILVSIIAFIVESMPNNHGQSALGFKSPFMKTEAVCIAVFTTEFIVRSLSCPRLRDYCMNMFTWIDLLAIVPFYINLFLGSNESSSLVILRVLRLFRLFRLLKLGRNLETVEILNIAIGRTFFPLLVSMIGVNAVSTILFASLITNAEHAEVFFDEDLQRYVRRNDSRYSDAGQEIEFQSIPDSMWWAWVTLTTVGYGDMYPRTGLGKGVASVAMLLGLIIVGIPLTLLASAYEEVMAELRQKKRARARSQAFQEKILDFRLKCRVSGALDALVAKMDASPEAALARKRESVEPLRGAMEDPLHDEQVRSVSPDQVSGRRATLPLGFPDDTERPKSGGKQRNVDIDEEGEESVQFSSLRSMPRDSERAFAALERQVASGFASLEQRVARYEADQREQQQMLLAVMAAVRRMEGMLRSRGGVEGPPGSVVGAGDGAAPGSPPPHSPPPLCAPSGHAAVHPLHERSAAQRRAFR